MKPITYDFDVVTDTPAPKRRAPEPAEQAPQADAEGERRGRSDAAPPEPRPSVQAAE
jgi:hypothetical protein